MIKLFSLKQQQQKDGEGTSEDGTVIGGPGGNAASAAAANRNKAKKTSAAQLRISKDLNELELPTSCTIDFPDKDDPLNFRLSISPDQGFYKGGAFWFSFKVSSNYPHEPPKVHCDTKVYHPNIDPMGNICLNILREDWKPVLTIQAIILGLHFLLLDPNPEDPLNREAAEMLQSNKRLFEQNVRRVMQGGPTSSSVYYN